MAEQEGSTQSQKIDTSQPTPLKGLKVRSSKAVETVNCLKLGGGIDGEDRIIKVNKADYNEEIHGEIVKDKLTSRKKKAKKKTRAAAE